MDRGCAIDIFYFDLEKAEVINSEFHKAFTKTALLTEELKDLLQNNVLL